MRIILAIIALAALGLDRLVVLHRQRQGGGADRLARRAPRRRLGRRGRGHRRRGLSLPRRHHGARPRARQPAGRLGLVRARVPVPHPRLRAEPPDRDLAARAVLRDPARRHARSARRPCAARSSSSRTSRSRSTRATIDLAGVALIGDGWEVGIASAILATRQAEDARRRPFAHDIAFTAEGLALPEAWTDASTAAACSRR